MPFFFQEQQHLPFTAVNATILKQLNICIIREYFSGLTQSENWQLSHPDPSLVPVT